MKAPEESAEGTSGNVYKYVYTYTSWARLPARPYVRVYVCVCECVRGWGGRTAETRGAGRSLHRWRWPPLLLR